jgi:hypothetical protein
MRRVEDEEAGGSHLTACGGSGSCCGVGKEAVGHGFVRASRGFGIRVCFPRTMMITMRETDDGFFLEFFYYGSDVFFSRIFISCCFVVSDFDGCNCAIAAGRGCM